MTPKEAYEARKAERKARPQYGGYDQVKDAELTDMLDRFVTAVEQIAETLRLNSDCARRQPSTPA
jgi:hypothetical protein